MKKLSPLAAVIFVLLALGFSSLRAKSGPRHVHVIVALCDNEYQGIVPVSESLGNGDDPASNLYWGALYGVKTHLKKSAKWELIHTLPSPKNEVLERVVFRHESGGAYLIADAYRGREIKEATVDFLRFASGNGGVTESFEAKGNKYALKTGGAADLIAYVGHDGLMDFRLSSYPAEKDGGGKDVIILACASRPYFSEAIKEAGAKPLVWTTGLMAPEAYTLEAALEGWVKGESDQSVRERAAGAYAKYQKCGLKSAMRLLVSGWE